MTADEYETELAARRAIVASYGAPPGYVPHCGVCGKPLPCACGTMPVASVPPIVAPIAAPAPMPVPARPVVTRYGADYCPVCNFDARYCRGHSPSDPPAQDGAESDLTRRIAEAQARRA